MRAILSVYDKTGIVGFARGLNDLGVELFSTGGTKGVLEEAGIPVTGIDELTGFPEILGGRVKTLHPKLHGGLLGRRRDPEHQQQMAQHGIEPIDVVVVNLYPFLATVRQPGAMHDEIIEQIDIGGPSMVRSGAKNHEDVVVVVDPEDYDDVLRQMRSGSVGLEARRRLAAKAFQHTAVYDTHVASFLRGPEVRFPDELTLVLRKITGLRYGENPHQGAAFYREETLRDTPPGLVTAKQLHGKQLSYNNTYDLDSAWAIVSDYKAPCVAIIKHGNPCGLACSEDLTDAFRRALAGDPQSAFGGAIGINRVVDEATAREIEPVFFEDLVAPGYTPEALEILQRKKDLRVVSTEQTFDSEQTVQARRRELDYKRVLGGFLVQQTDALDANSFTRQVVTKREPTLDEITALLFAWRAVKHVRSNAIVLARKLALVGVGAGQMSRVDAVRLAIQKAGERAAGSVMASDAFFPFPDSVDTAAAAGVTAIIQPGGSVRDEESIKAANQHQMAMVFTGQRHFRH